MVSPQDSQKSLRRRFLSLSVVAICIVSVLGSFLIVKDIRLAVRKTADKAEYSARGVLDYVKDTLGNEREAVPLLSEEPQVLSLLTSGSSADSAAAYHVLDGYKNNFGFSVIYVMDASGKVIASTNRDSATSFVGKNYGFRPYFRQAITGGNGRYFALGVTSNKLGYYVSAPVRDDKGQVRGVVVINVDLDGFKEYLNRFGTYLLTDERGIVLLSSLPGVSLKSLWGLEPSEKKILAASRQFGDGTFDPVFPPGTQRGKYLVLDGTRYVDAYSADADMGLAAMALMTTARIDRDKLTGTGILILVCVILLLLGYLLYWEGRNTLTARVNEKKYRTILETVPDLVLILDSAGNIQSTNGKEKERFGYEQENIVGRSIVELFPRVRREFMERSLEVLLKMGWARDEIYPLARADGEEVEISLSLSRPVSPGDAGNIVCVISDISELKKTERKLIAERDRTSKYIDAAEAILVLLDMDGKVRLVNLRGREILGRSREDILGKVAIENFIVPRARSAALELFGRVASGEPGGADSHDFPVLMSGGEERVVSWKLTPIVEDGAITGVLCAGEDVTQVKEYEQELRNSEHRYKTLSEQLTLHQSATMNIVEDLAEAKDQMEENNADLVRAKEELHEYSLGLEAKVSERTFELSILYEISNAISYTLDPHQLLRLIMESLFKVVKFDVCAALLFEATASSITMKTSYPQAAKFTEEIKESLTEATSMLTGEDIRNRPATVFVIPPDSEQDAPPDDHHGFDQIRSYFNVPFVVQGKTIGMINVSSCQENAFGEDDIKLIYTISNQASNAIERLRAVVTEEKSKMESMVESMVEGAVMIDQRDDVVVFNPQARIMLSFGPDEDISSEEFKERMSVLGMEKSIKECKLSNKQISRVVITRRENTERFLQCNVSPVKNPKEETIGVVITLRDITREKEVDRMKTEFVSTVSHELRTPLSITKEGISLVLDKIPGELNEKQYKILDTARDNIDRLARIINSLLDISKIEEGKTELRKDIVDICLLVKQVAASFGQMIKEKGVELKLDLPDSPMPIYADADRIIQVLTNLVANAYNFTEKGHIEIRVKGFRDTVECSVNDTGIGIAEEDLSKLFMKFQQIGRTAGAGAKGTGLGLSIARGIVELHHGDIRVESEKNKGTAFIFTLPTYTTEEVFKEHVDSAIIEAEAKGKSISLIIVSVSGLKDLGKEASDEEIQNILGGVAATVENSLRQQRDVLIKGYDEMIAILPDCDRKNALRVEGRLGKALEDYLENLNITEKVSLHFGSATYPEEAGTGRDLIRVAKNA